VGFKQLIYKIGKALTQWSSGDDITKRISEVLASTDNVIPIGSRVWSSMSVSTTSDWDYVVTREVVDTIGNILGKPLLREGGGAYSDMSSFIALYHFTMPDTNASIHLVSVAKDDMKLYAILNDAIAMESNEYAVRDILATRDGRVAITAVTIGALQLLESRDKYN
jgi:hypothetical protein